jgi:hypothetical protein
MPPHVVKGQCELATAAMEVMIIADLINDPGVL